MASATPQSPVQVVPVSHGFWASVGSAILHAIETGLGSVMHLSLSIILGAIGHLLAAIPVWILQQYTSAGYIRVLLNDPWAHSLVLLSQAVAVSVLGLRLAWEAFHQYVLRSQGQSTDVMGLVRNAAIAAFSIFAFPPLSVRLIQFANDLATNVMSVMGSQVGAFGSGIGNMLGGAVTLGSAAAGPVGGAGGALAFAVLFVIVSLLAVVVLVLIFFQGMVRTVQAFAAGVLGPAMAVGWMSDGGGTAAAWWRSLLILCMSQAVQIMLLYSATAISLAPGVPAYLRPFLFLATLWVTYQTPHSLQEYAFHSGVGGGAAGAGSMAASLALRMLLL